MGARRVRAGARAHRGSADLYTVTFGYTSERRCHADAIGGDSHEHCSANRHADICFCHGDSYAGDHAFIVADAHSHANCV